MTCPPGFQGRYTVGPGDTIWLIAQRFGVSFDVLLAANPHIPNVGFLFPGDILCVPGTAPTPPCRMPASCPQGFIPYTVSAGDTMFTLARRFVIPLTQLIAANPHVTDPTAIVPCDVLCVPAAAACPPGFHAYTVQPGDTMFRLAQRFGIPLSQLVAANPHIINPDVLFAGDTVCVPSVPSCSPGSQVYIVLPGDTMPAIAERFGVALDVLLAANPQIPGSAAPLPGDVLCIPSPPGPAAEATGWQPAASAAASVSPASESTGSGVSEGGEGGSTGASGPGQEAAPGPPADS